MFGNPFYRAGQAHVFCVPHLGSGEGGNESFHKGEMVIDGMGREERKGSRKTPRFLSSTTELTRGIP